MPVQTVLGLFFAERFTDYCVRRFPSLVTLRVLGLGAFVAVHDPDVIKQVFTGDRDVLRAGEANALLGTLARASVVVADGERHLRLRRLLLPPFHGEALRRHRELIREIALADVERWPAGQPWAVLPRMRAITLEVILRVVLGVRDEQRSERLRRVLPGVLGVGIMTLFAENAQPRLFEGRLGAKVFPWIRARREAERLLEEEIAAHRADPDGREDILALLLATRDEDGRGLTDEELRDQLLTLLIAGHETTASTLAWCLERLGRHPGALARLQVALATDDGDAHLEAVINETLRVRPAVDQVARKLASPMELAGHTVPAGTVVAASILGVQRSEAFAEPEQFRPERFLDGPAPPYAFIPFGGGARRCIGASFAVMEMKTVLRAVLESVALRAPASKPERPTRWNHFATAPGKGGRVIVTATRSASAAHAVARTAFLT